MFKKLQGKIQANEITKTQISEHDRMSAIFSRNNNMRDVDDIRQLTENINSQGDHELLQDKPTDKKEPEEAYPTLDKDGNLIDGDYIDPEIKNDEGEVGEDVQKIKPQANV